MLSGASGASTVGRCPILVNEGYEMEESEGVEVDIYTPGDGMARSGLMEILAVGNPMVRPSCFPATTTDEYEKGCPNIFEAATTLPAAMAFLMVEELIPGSSEAGRICSPNGSASDRYNSRCE